MTTIAYKNGRVAFDSRLTSGNTIISDVFKKFQVKNRVLFIFFGEVGRWDALVDAYFGKRIEIMIGDCNALVYDKGKLFDTSIDKSGWVYKSPIFLDTPEAFGSGFKYAFTAMDLGKTAEEAIEIAMKRDTGTGGIIRTLHVGEGVLTTNDGDNPLQV